MQQIGRCNVRRLPDFSLRYAPARFVRGLRADDIDGVGDHGVDAGRAQFAGARRVVDGPREHAQAGRVNGIDALAIEQRMLEIERDAAKTCSVRLPIVRELIGEQRARQRGCCKCGGFEGDRGKRRQQRWHGCAGPQRGCIERNGGAGFAFAAGRGLDLDVERDVLRDAEARDGGEGGRRLAGVGRRMPAAGVELRQLAPRVRIGATVSVRRAIERRVVQQERDAVGGELDVDLRHPIAVRMTEAKRCEGVLGREFARAAVRAERRVCPPESRVGLQFLESRVGLHSFVP